MSNPPSLSEFVINILRKAADENGKLPVSVVEKVMTELNWSQTTSTMRKELEEIAGKLNEASSETKAMLGGDTSKTDLQGAANELDEAIQYTEEAANTIMDAAEAVMAKTDDEDIQDKMMEIITACNFQDISGQRLRKVATVLTFIEPRVKKLISLLVKEDEIPEATTDKASIAVETGDDSALLNGPQLKGEGVSQAEIDAMFGD